MFFAVGTQLRKHFGRPRTPKSQYNDSQAFRVCAVSGGGAGGGGEGADCANAERFLLCDPSEPVGAASRAAFLARAF